MQRVLSDARCLANPESDMDLMPLRVSLQTESVGGSGPLETAQSRFRQRLERDPDLLDEWLSAHAQRFELEATSDITTHFEAVTGHRVTDLKMGQSMDRRALRAEKSPSSHSGEVSRRSADRHPIERARSGSLVLATVMVLFVLTLGSYESDPLRGLTGSAATSESILFGSLGDRTRGQDDLALQQRRVEVLLALDGINEARTSVLGFHTGYEPISLRSAVEHLKRAMDMGPANEPVPEELNRLYREALRILE